MFSVFFLCQVCSGFCDIECGQRALVATNCQVDATDCLSLASCMWLDLSQRQVPAFVRRNGP